MVPSYLSSGGKDDYQTPLYTSIVSHGCFSCWDGEREDFLRAIRDFTEREGLSGSAQTILANYYSGNLLHDVGWLLDPDSLFRIMRLSANFDGLPTSDDWYRANSLTRGAFLVCLHKRLARGLAFLLLFYLLLVTSLFPGWFAVACSVVICTIGYVLSSFWFFQHKPSIGNLIRLENEVRKHVREFRQSRPNTRQETT